MRILVTGSRDWGNYDLIASVLVNAVRDYMHEHPDLQQPVSDWVTVVHGACPTGADFMADDFCRANYWPVERHPAAWKMYGRRAGPLRNREMVKAGADICLAFIKNGSKGATMTARLAEQAGIPTKRYLVETSDK
jgi:hypothetical protein